MSNQDRQRFRAARLTTSIAALASATAIAACGSSAPGRATAPRRAGPRVGASALSPRAATATNSMLAFSTCMRANGVPHFPDLHGSGILIQGSPGTITVNGVPLDPSAFQAARARCRRYLPARHQPPVQAVQQSQRELQFAKCMRNHGVPKFPDPRVISSSGGNQMVYLPGVNPQSPAFQTAAKACGGGPKGP